MKKKFITIGAFGIFAGIVFSSNQSGTYSAMSNKTGSNGGTGCATCHGSQNAATVVTITLSDGTNTVTEYTPGQTYDVILAATNSGTAHPKFGFQLTAGKAASSATAAGTFATNGVSGVALRANNTLIEQTTALAANTSGSTNTYSKTFKWTAPAAGTGDIKFFAVLNAVNGNGDHDAGDQWNFGTSAAIKEKVSGTSTTNIALLEGVTLYPNPATQAVHIRLEQAKAGSYQFQIVDAVGRIMQTSTTQFDAAQAQYTLPTQALPNGNYYLRITHASGTVAMPFQKL